MLKEEKVKEMVKELEGAVDAPEELLEQIAEIAVDKGYCKKIRGVWVIDKNYSAREKIRCTCSQCGHYQTAKKTLQKIFYTRYCPYCGAEMSMPK